MTAYRWKVVDVNGKYFSTSFKTKKAALAWIAEMNADPKMYIGANLQLK